MQKIIGRGGTHGSPLTPLGEPMVPPNPLLLFVKEKTPSITIQGGGLGGNYVPPTRKGS